MFELRWLEVETGKTLINEWGYFYQETTKTLQYRQQVNMTEYSQIHESGSGGFVTSSRWTDWQAVPNVVSAEVSK